MRENRLNRQPSGPGRSTKRPRTSAPSAASTGATGAAATASAPKPASPVRNSALARAAARIPRPRNRFAFTRRALILFAVLAVLGLSFAGSLRVWVIQSQELAATNAEIERQTARVAELEDQLQRWNDPAYVKAQARQRLGWVMPGEVGYRVVGADGQVLSGTTEIEGVGASRTSELAARWWDKLGTSIRQADEPPLQTNPLVSPETADGTPADQAAEEAAAEAAAGEGATG